MSIAYDKWALRRLRAKRGITVPELAEAAGLWPNTVSYIDRGVTSPRADTLAKIASVLQVGIEEFFKVKAA